MAHSFPLHTLDNRLFQVDEYEESSEEDDAAEGMLPEPLKDQLPLEPKTLSIPIWSTSGSGPSFRQVTFQVPFHPRLVSMTLRVL